MGLEGVEITGLILIYNLIVRVTGPIGSEDPKKVKRTQAQDNGSVASWLGFDKKYKCTVNVLLAFLKKFGIFLIGLGINLEEFMNDSVVKYYTKL